MQPNDNRPLNQSAPPPLTKSAQEAGVQLPKIVDFNDLSRCGDEVWISFNGGLYRLRSTKQGKLILTK